MRVDIRDNDALQAVSPDALAAYARAAGWAKVESYGKYSDVYAAKGLPEIILPRTQRLGDYASVVAQLIKIFTRVAERDELALYRDLVNANRDVVRVRAGGGDDGSLTVNDGVDLIDGSRDMLLAAACSLRERQPLYRAGANKEATDLLSRVRLGQTEQGSFVVALVISIPPPIPTLFDDFEDRDAPIERRMTKRLIEALGAARSATESTIAGDRGAFAKAVDMGVSANLCEALDRMISPFRTLDVSVTWSRTRPMESAWQSVGFAKADAAILREAARSFRDREPQPDRILSGPIHRLRRDEWESDGVVTMRALVDGQWKSVKVYARRTDYDRLTEAHRQKSEVAMRGDLEQYGQRLSLRNARIVSIDTNEEEDSETTIVETNDVSSIDG